MTYSQFRKGSSLLGSESTALVNRFPFRGVFCICSWRIFLELYLFSSNHSYYQQASHMVSYFLQVMRPFLRDLASFSPSVHTEGVLTVSEKAGG